MTSSAGLGASSPGWRQFTFFTPSSIKSIHSDDIPPEIFKSPLEIATITSSPTFGVLVADIHGSIYLLGQDFESRVSWLSGRVTHMLERRGWLVTLCEEDGVKVPVLKIWQLDGERPLLMRNVKLQLGVTRSHPVSTIAASPSLSSLAIGLADGSVLLYRHVDQSLLSSPTALTSLPKPRTLASTEQEPITGLGFSQSTLALYVVTTSRVLLYPSSGRGQPTVVDEVGCALGCAVMDPKGEDIILGRDEAIYVCGPDGRGGCWAYEGPKSHLATHEGTPYLLIVSPPFVPKASSASATVRHFVSSSRSDSTSNISKVTIFDPENKLVAYSGTFTSGVREVVSAWGDVYVLCDDGSLTSLVEHPLPTKLQSLYSKNLFSLALNLASSSSSYASHAHVPTSKLSTTNESEKGNELTADIHRRYGDHLYEKGDYDGAMAQYVKTIGWVGGSYVVRKFLETQRTHNLVTYLQELHSRGLANSDHTTLLLNTYTKLKDVSRLEAFIRSTGAAGVRKGEGELPFDLDTAIRVLRQAGYFDHAAYLAKRFGRHEDYLRIMIEDVGGVEGEGDGKGKEKREEGYRDALGYLRSLSLDGEGTAESNLARYGRALLDALPEETTALLVDLCTGSVSPTSEEEKEEEVAKGGGPSYLSYLALNRNSIVAAALESAPVPPSPSIKTVRPGDAATITGASRQGSIHGEPPTPLALQPEKKPQKLLSPRLYFAHFVDHMDQFVYFLETVASRRWGQSVSSPHSSPFPEDKNDQIAVWNTLLELYLTLPEHHPKVLEVLKSGDNLPYDPIHALILCSTKGYTEGLVLLWEKMGMYEDVLRFYMSSSSSSEKVVEHLDRYAGSNPQLYPLVLRYLTSTEELLQKHEKDVRRILEVVEKDGILTPVGVIQVLSRNGVASVGLVREWLMGRVRDARAEIAEDREWTSSYRLETAAKLKQVEDLSDTEHPKVFHVTRCSSCSGQLDLPSVHFMCNHSYHQRCLLDQDTECPLCAREHSVIREIRRNNEQLADQHEVFLGEVEEQGFKAVADAFARGVLTLGGAEVGAIG